MGNISLCLKKRSDGGGRFLIQFALIGDLMKGDQITSEERSPIGTYIGGRITSEEKSTISTYIGVIVATVLVAWGIYFFFLAQERTKEMTGFDPNRPLASDATLRRRLKPEQFLVVREGGTETAFQNEFWNNERTGIYVDVITGEPLFTSFDKFDGGTGRPTFTKP